ncbi:hypothetical protein AeNC1_016474 [Aphanomyces euteiches]|nr:hypothetical protein AeNC1_016474 [Aphanomyces euteiches]
MRLLFSLALATSAVMAFTELHQDTPVMLAHKGAQMHSATGDLRVLQGGKHGKRGRGKQAALEMSSEESAARRLAAVRWNIPGVSSLSLGSRAKNAVKGVAAKGRQMISRRRTGPQGLSALGGM